MLTFGISGSVSLQSRSSRKVKATQKLESCKWGCPETGLPCYSGAQNLGSCSKTQASTQAYEAAAQVAQGRVALGTRLHSHSSGLLTHGSD
jgi:hypothetical protein